MEFPKTCRFCLENEDNSKFFPINQEIKTGFEELTNIELVISEKYSNYCCESCRMNVETCQNIRKEFIKVQNILYNQIKEERIDILENPVINFLQGNLECKQEKEFEAAQLPCVSWTLDKLEKDSVVHEDSSQNPQHQETLVPERYEQEPTKTTKSRQKRTKKPQKVQPVKRIKVSKEERLEKKRLQREYQKTKIICPICGIPINREILRIHNERVHLKLKKFQCDLCGKKYFKKNDIVEHLKAHFDLKDWECDTCKSRYVSRNSLMCHVKAVHLKKYEIPCNICGKMYNASQMSYHHRAKHSGERPFACDIIGCQKRFHSKYELNHHKNGVHAESVTCNICGKELKNKLSMRSHLKYHSDKRFPCTYTENGIPCEKSYITLHLLQKHVDVIHLKKKKLSCSHCQRTYNLRSDLNTHLYTFHERKKIKCDLCSTTVSSKEYYCRHIRSHHSEMNEQEKKDFVEKILKTNLEELYNFQIDAKDFKERTGKTTNF